MAKTYTSSPRKSARTTALLSPEIIYKPGDSTLERTLETSPTPVYHPPRDAKYNSKGLEFGYSFSQEGVNPFNQLEWDRRKATITDDKGKVIFEQEGVAVPNSWSMLATNVMASKYLYGDRTKSRESSAAAMVHRVSKTVADWGARDGYFATSQDAEAFQNDLTWLLINQHGAFNSPVWFNAGLHHVYGVGGQSKGNFVFDRKTGKAVQSPNQYQYPQTSACFIQHVDDTMESIMELARSEAMLFKFGSGSGTDLSTLRSTAETVSGGGKPSGPMSFLKIYDAGAGVVKSGGKTRRAAKMNTMHVDHPDIRSFIEAKSREERKAWALIDAGYSGDFNGEAYGSVAFQNENLSVRVTDDFMRAVVEDKEWVTHHVTNPAKEGPRFKARELMKGIAEGTWVCGDPGVQYTDTINRWHTAKNSGPINSSNPCSEYLFLDNTACNLASLNLQKFLGKEGRFDVERFQKAVRVFITAQEILVDNASYPTPKIAELSHEYRTLGLGFANLGGLEMRLGLPYDSEQGSTLAAAITSIMHNSAYEQSSRIAHSVGAFPGFKNNQIPMLGVMGMHRDAAHKIDESALPEDQKHLGAAAREAADSALQAGHKNGYRNAQVTVLAPTGTIGFLMDADTTGVEPDIALVKYKLLAGGGTLKIANQTVRPTLTRLGYTPEQIERTIDYISGRGKDLSNVPGLKSEDKSGLEELAKGQNADQVMKALKAKGYSDEIAKQATFYICGHDTIEGAPDLKPEHLPIFDCAFKPKNGERFISYKGHIRMMAAVQPHLSGAISKTVNMPKDATPAEIMDTYIEGWKLGIKALAIYRDGCKRSQPVSTGSYVAEKADQLFFTRGASETGLRPVSTGDLEKLISALPQDQIAPILEKMGYSQGPKRRRMPKTRESITHKFAIGDHEGYLTIGKYPNGNKPGELFIYMAKEGSTVGGLMDTIGTLTSMCLQYGVPLKDLVNKFAHMRFEPSGFTGDESVPVAKSISDYIFRWMGTQFLSEGETPKALTPLQEQQELQPSNITPETKLEEDQSAQKKSAEERNDGWIHICPQAGCGALAKYLDAKGCSMVCKNNHTSQTGCGG